MPTITIKIPPKEFSSNVAEMSMELDRLEYELEDMLADAGFTHYTVSSKLMSSNSPKRATRRKVARRKRR